MVMWFIAAYLLQLAERQRVCLMSNTDDTILGQSEKTVHMWDSALVKL